ncbi:hypothetical protein, partial [Bacillus ndiopicus]|uniref:hypothetical protein n=1 Tax=Bacillus ndiopicus TaxID=1347368 RepID=UPI0005A5EB4D
MSGMKTEMHGMKVDIQELKIEQKKTNERLDGIEAKQHIVYEQTGKLTEYYTEIMARFDQLATKEDLDYFDQKIAKHEREIFKLKNRA